MKKKSVFLLLFLLIFTFSACAEDDSKDGGRKAEDQVELLSLTIEEVAEFDGKDGSLAYIVVQGVIYDVTDEWTNGQHNGVMAGTDATDDILGAPHGESVLEDLVIIGNIVLAEEPPTVVMVDYTIEELAAFDGKDGNKAYIAVNGVIYDVSDEWSNGEHNGVMAGTDATSDIMGASHGETVLKNLTEIGRIIATVVVEETTYITLAELATYDGLNGNKAYIAVNGIVYDVTDEWNSNEHNGVMAGTDATSNFADSPHSQGTLDSLEVVGEINN